MKFNQRSARCLSFRRATNAASLTPWAAGPTMLALVCGGGLLTGCGSGHGNTSISAPSGASVAAEKGRATVSIVWPTHADAAAHSRLIPLATNSIVVSFVQNGAVIAQQILARPTTGSTTTATFLGLTPGAYTVLVTAFASGDGSGVGLAGASATTTIISAQTTTVGISLVSQVDHLTLTLPAATLPVASVSSLTSSAMDASGNLLPLTTSALNFASSNAAVATVDAAGAVVGVGAGTANITVTDNESGKSAIIPANVVLDYSYLPPTTVVDGQRVTYHTTADGLEFYDLQAGSGAFPQPGQVVTITYTGALVDGAIFDSSNYHSPGTLSFYSQEELVGGKEQVIPGFDEAVAGMQVGTVRRVAIPANLAYGSTSPGSGIPANATLIFDLKLLSIKSAQ